MLSIILYLNLHSLIKKFIYQVPPNFIIIPITFKIIVLVILESITFLIVTNLY